MNARQTKKQLKKVINALKSDNNLMRRIIADSPAMQELYDLYNMPLKVAHTTIPFQKYKAKREIPPYMIDVVGVVEHTKQALAKDLLEGVKDNITYELLDADTNHPTLTASVFIGKEV